MPTEGNTSLTQTEIVAINKCNRIRSNIYLDYNKSTLFHENMSILAKKEKIRGVKNYAKLYK